MGKKLLITSYQNPDLDGTASTYAYSELLRKKGIDATGAVFGNPHREAGFVMKTFKINKLPDADKIIGQYGSVILVDASDVKGISNKINPAKVVEIIDHRKVNEADKFPNAKVQIEFVGAAATLIAEKFFEEKIEISDKSAALILSAIVSNTINFKAKVTTIRDRKMFKWLKSKTHLPGNYVKNMFLSKSTFTKPLKEIFMDDFSVIELNGKKVAAVQLEIVGVEKFIRKNLAEIKQILTEIMTRESVDIGGLTCIDVEKGFNMFVVVDDYSQKVLGDVLSVKFLGGVGKRRGVIMRKEIGPLIKDYLAPKD